MAKREDIRRGDGYVTERATSTGVVRYRARWHDGRSWRSKTFATYDEASDHLRTIGRSKRAGTYEPESRMTVATMLYEYLERNREKRWSKNTYANYKQIADRIIEPRIGKWAISGVRTLEYRKLFDKLDREYSASRLTVIRALLSGMYREAIELGITDTNPLTHIRVHQPPLPDFEVWTPDEILQLLDHVADDKRRNAWYRLALTTGMRPGEMRALAWRHINFDTGEIHVQDTISRDERFREYIKHGTKTGTTRIIHPPESTMKALKAWRPEQAREQLRTEHWHDLGLVFPRPNGLQLSQQTHARDHRAVCLAAGIRYLKPHGARHTVATTLLEEGYSDKLVSKILGHSRTRTTNDLYNHPSKRAHKAVASWLDELLDVGEKGESMGELDSPMGESSEHG